ncbi:MAG: hypothetical protein E2604_13505, partial [Flavobacterium sp.]|nr:hypothetical protein [Flavobacterium sp.]
METKKLLLNRFELTQCVIALNQKNRKVKVFLPAIYRCRLMIVFFFMLTSVLSWGQAKVLWTNPLNANNISSANPYTTGETKSAYLTVSGIGKGAGLNTMTTNNAYRASGFSTSNSLTVSNNDYFYFELTPIAGYKLNLTNFIYTGARQTGSNGGPTSYSFRSSINNNYGTGIGSPNANG